MQEERKTNDSNGQLLKSTKIEKTKVLGEGQEQPGSSPSLLADNVFIGPGHL